MHRRIVRVQRQLFIGLSQWHLRRSRIVPVLHFSLHQLPKPKLLYRVSRRVPALHEYFLHSWRYQLSQRLLQDGLEILRTSHLVPFKLFHWRNCEDVLFRVRQEKVHKPEYEKVRKLMQWRLVCGNEFGLFIMGREPPFYADGHVRDLVHPILVPLHWDTLQRNCQMGRRWGQHVYT